jgi:hypothetical protein
MINVYMVLSEYIDETPGGYGPPEGGHIAEVVAANSHGQAKYLAIKASRKHGWMASDMNEMPRCVIRKLGVEDLTLSGVLQDALADKWWGLAPENVWAPGEGPSPS